MSAPDPLTAAVVAELLVAADARHALLRAIVESARAAFAARSASIALLDRYGHDLVFAAVAGEGAARLQDSRFPATAGIAGEALASRRLQVVDDLLADHRFAGDVAMETGYVPDAMMVAPLLHEDSVLGVLSVLDREGGRHSAADRELLAVFAEQAAITVALTRRVERADQDELRAAAAFVGRLLDGPANRRAAALRVLGGIQDLLR